MSISGTTSTTTNPFSSLVNNPAYTSSSTSGSGSSGTSAASSFTANYNTFITLLTTQLQNQNPLNPTDPNQFTTELIQLTGVEQQMETNSSLLSVASSLSSLGLSSGIGYMGKTVQATGSTAPLQNGAATWDYTLGQSAANVSLSIADSSGKVVWTGTGDGTLGTHALNWNGQDMSGTQLADGDYTLTATATDGSGNTVSTTTSVVGTVTGVDSSGGQAQLMLGGVSVPLANVTQVTG
ncbi:MAG: flagellar hook assembly protein FlgD [Magnetospirillum sp.]|nr:flagellar hook assembly protein FlgD [Magnetospirillum sp.]